jgi:hypothetical protein
MLGMTDVTPRTGTNGGPFLLQDPVTGTFFTELGTAGAPGVQLSSSDGLKATYRAAILAFTPVANPTDVLVVQGSASKTVRVKRLVVQGAATSSGNMPCQILRRSSAGTLGSAVLTALTAGKHDINDPAPTATVSTVGTANFTALGVNAGVLGAGRIQLTAAGSGTVINPLDWEFSTRSDKAMVLRGASDYVCVNLNGAAVPAGASIDIEVEWEEDNS